LLSFLLFSRAAIAGFADRVSAHDPFLADAPDFQSIRMNVAENPCLIAFASIFRNPFSNPLQVKVEAIAPTCSIFSISLSDCGLSSPATVSDSRLTSLGADAGTSAVGVSAFLWVYP
jgi:hypothetical protein